MLTAHSFSVDHHLLHALQRDKNPDADYQTVSPTKEKIREYMTRRQTEHRPPPSQAEIRRRLGWKVIQPQKDADVAGLPNNYMLQASEFYYDCYRMPERASALKLMFFFMTSAFVALLTMEI